jgi:hypothetical protein
MIAARRTAVLVLAGVFAVGLAAGAFLEDVVDDVAWPFTQHADGGDTRSGDPWDDDAEEAFLERLGLRREQLKSIDRILDAREDRLERYWEGKLPELRGMIDSSRAEIRVLLTPEQQAAYDRWIRDISGAAAPKP